MPADQLTSTQAVLIVDDDVAIRELARRILEPRGYAVHDAASGVRALAMLEEGVAVQAVVTDLKMAEGSGGWFLANLAYDHPALLSRVLVVSGDPEGASAAHIVARWRCPVLAKPFTPPQLVAAIEGLGVVESDGEKKIVNGEW